MEVSVIFPVIALIIGWSLNELSRYFGFRQQRHGALGQTLSQLLVIRAHMCNIKLLTDLMAKDFKMPLSSIPELKRLYSELMPYSGEEVDKKIRDATAVIASFDPLLASMLSTNISASDVFTKLSYKIEGKGESDELFIDYLLNLENIMLPLLDEATLILAKKHGLLTYFRVKRLMNKGQYIPEDIINRMQEFKDNLDELSAKNS